MRTHPEKPSGGGRACRVIAAAALLAAGPLFGVVFALVKGTGGGWHLAFGNLSAPWLLLPWRRGALGRGGHPLAPGGSTCC